MQRVLVVGIPCSGKTTLSKGLAARRGLPHIEVDQYHWGLHWTMREDFYDAIDTATAGPAWIADDWGTPLVQDLLWSRADLLVWLDPPRHQAEYRAVRRTLSRVVRRQVLAGGNRDAPLSWLSPHHPVRYVWSQHRAQRDTMEQRLLDPRWSGLEVVRLRTDAEIREFLEQLTAA